MPAKNGAMIGRGNGRGSGGGKVISSGSLKIIYPLSLTCHKIKYFMYFKMDNKVISTPIESCAVYFNQCLHYFVQL